MLAQSRKGIEIIRHLVPTFRWLKARPREAVVSSRRSISFEGWRFIASFSLRRGFEIGIAHYVPGAWGWIQEYRVIRLEWIHKVG